MSDDYAENIAAILAEHRRLVPAPITDGVYADLAEAIVQAHNAEGRDLNALSFVKATCRCDVAQRHAVALELPPWAQRSIDLWKDAA